MRRPTDAGVNVGPPDVSLSGRVPSQAEVSSGVHTITGVPTSITAFVGRVPKAPVNDAGKVEAGTVTSQADFDNNYGGLTSGFPLTYAVADFFLNGGSIAIIAPLTAAADTPTDVEYGAAFDLLKDVDIFNILCIPPNKQGVDTPSSAWVTAAGLCKDRRAFLLVDRASRGGPPAASRAAP